MQIKIMGTREECDILLATMNKEFVLEVSPYYPNRGNSKLVRCYITTSIKTDAYEKTLEPELRKANQIQDQHEKKYKELLEIFFGH